MLYTPYRNNSLWVRPAAIFLGISVPTFLIMHRAAVLPPLWSWLVSAGLAAFILCAVDKSCALKGAARTPEMAFYFSALAGGAFGLILGMKMFRHKTRKASFQVMVFLIAVLQFLIIARIYNRF